MSEPTSINMTDGEELGSPDANRLRKRAAEVNAQAEQIDAANAEVVRKLRERNQPPGPQPPSVS